MDTVKMTILAGFTPEILFSGMQPGSLVSIPKASHNDVVAALESYPPAAGWQLAVWGDPYAQPPDELSYFIHVLRTEGMTDAQIEAQRVATLNPNAPRRAMDHILFAPLREGFYARAGCGKRTTKQRWEVMQVGHQRLMRAPLRDVRFTLGNAMVSRGLPWEFRINRVHGAEESTGMPTPVWRITRVK